MTIVTNSLTIAAECAVDAHMKVIVTGGLGAGELVGSGGADV